MERVEASPPAPEDRVADKELLYRAVREEFFTRRSETEVTISENAYQDSKKQPSVDRAHINGFNPEPTRFRPSDAVVSLVAEDVRSIKTVFDNSPSGKPTGLPYDFDVIPRPIKDDPDPNVKDNPAHAQIETNREMSRGTFERLKGALAYIHNSDASTIVLDPYERVVYFTRRKKVFHTQTCHHLRSVGTPCGLRRALAQGSPCSRCRPDQGSTPGNR